jgi:hypothetical protein
MIMIADDTCSYHFLFIFIGGILAPFELPLPRRKKTAAFPGH